MENFVGLCRPTGRSAMRSTTDVRQGVDDRVWCMSVHVFGLYWNDGHNDGTGCTGAQEHGNPVLHLTATSGRSAGAHHHSMIERSGSSFTNLVSRIALHSAFRAEVLPSAFPRI